MPQPRQLIGRTLALLLLGLTGLVASCSQPSGTASTTLILEDIEFATYQVDGETRSLKLDLYQPKSSYGASPAKPLPVILYIHGGGWEEQSRKYCPGEVLSEYGYAVVCTSYRYSYEAPFPAQIYDVKAAVRWIRANAYVHKLDSDNIGVIGESAGGHLGALLGTSAGVSELEADPLIESDENREFSSEVHAVVDWYGPTDFSQIPVAFEGDPSPAEYKQLQDRPWAHLTRVVTRLLGGPISEYPEQIALANPINFITEEDPPFLVVHGVDDNLVPIAQSELLVAALEAEGVDVDFYPIEDWGHRFKGDNGEPVAPEILGRTMTFLYRHLKYDGYKSAQVE